MAGVAIQLGICSLTLLVGSGRLAQGPQLRASSLARERARPLVYDAGLRPKVRSDLREVCVPKADIAASVQAALPDLSRAQCVVDELLTAAELLNSRGECVLRPADISTALDDMHLLNRQSQPEGAAPPPDFLPEELREPRFVDVTALVRDLLPRVLATHPIFLRMAEELLDDQFYASVYFGAAPRGAAPSLSFAQLARQLVASIVVFEQLVAMPHRRRRCLAAYYEEELATARAAATGGSERRGPQLACLRKVTHKEKGAVAATLVRSLRHTLMGGFLDLKG
jgi:hypothetical protein